MLCRVDPRCPVIVQKALHVVRGCFRLDLGHGIHGLPHWSRVFWHGRALAREMGVDPCLVAWFAFLHDSQRRDDGVDAGHGGRAADFAVGLRRRGVLTELDGRGFEQLCEAMRLHSEGHTESEAGIVVCWDADWLDLGRVGITPVAHRLCTAPAREPGRIERAVRMSRASWRRR